MPFVVKTLGSGSFIGAGTTSMYTVPANASAIINNVRLVNTAAATSPNYNLQVAPSGGAPLRNVAKYNQTMIAGDLLTMTDQLTLGAGDVLLLSVSAGTSTFSYMVNGVERI
jgi:hypothetical protein